MKKFLLASVIATASIAIVGCNDLDNQQPANVNNVSLDNASLIGNESIVTPYGTIGIEHNYITDEGSAILFDAMDMQRASQAYIWSTPLVSMITWRDEMNQAYNTHNRGEFAVLESYNEKLGVVTGNLTTPYIFSFDSVAEGPLEVKYPAGMTAGAFLDFWQRPIADVGLTGPDQGKGGHYIIVGPNDDPEKYKAPGVHVFQSETNNVFLGLRILESDPAYSEKFQSQLKISAYGEKPVEIKFNAGYDKPWSGTAPRDLSYWQRLHKNINEEPIREQDKVWIAMLEPLGISIGKPFNPDERQKKLLLEGLAMGELMLRNLQTNPRFAEVYWDNTNWYKSFDFTIPQITDTRVELDERAVWFYEAVSSTEGMVNPVVGKGQVYMTTKRDSDGNLLRADKTYRLRVPADVPVGQFWSLTLYSEETRRPYENGEGTIRSVSLDSKLEDLVKNEDGSVDLYIGAHAPKGYEKNHMQTVGKDGWFVYFRLYAPLEGFFDKSFSLPDFEKID
ncbi:DUF1254 domain-containing protein [Thalassotalea agarivorans]|uniref:Uncharacterized conserved protein n=1 Tax=Thalassotalea agarivorans TaxID=349064 RepID=A0A1I0G989_THASX|nr:DUF1254 domain-containing protein [Thalassotalea agarivorans]SET67231.1 Uncharacterized conserved protein [Thalassotalea agarivorans]